MIRFRSILGIAVLVLASAAPPSWGWVRGSWGWRGGGGHLRIGIAGPWWPYWYPGYAYDPYYSDYPYYYPDPYAVPPYYDYPRDAYTADISPLAANPGRPASSSFTTVDRSRY